MKNLHLYKFDNFSQNGEDGIIEEILIRSFSEKKINKNQNTFDNVTNSVEKSNVSDVVENEIIENQTNSFDDNIINERNTISRFLFLKNFNKFKAN